MNFKKYLFIILGSLSVVTIFYIIFGTEAIKPTTKMTDNEFEKTMEVKLNTIVQPDPTKKYLASSNPYDYIKNDDYSYIVKQGKRSLNYMLKEFEKSPNDGLKEYIMAIACSEILNEKTHTWSTGKQWYKNYIQQSKVVQ